MIEVKCTESESKHNDHERVKWIKKKLENLSTGVCVHIKPNYNSRVLICCLFIYSSCLLAYISYFIRLFSHSPRIITAFKKRFMPLDLKWMNRAKEGDKTTNLTGQNGIKRETNRMKRFFSFAFAQHTEAEM